MLTLYIPLYMNNNKWFRICNYRQQWKSHNFLRCRYKVILVYNIIILIYLHWNRCAIKYWRICSRRPECGTCEFRFFLNPWRTQVQYNRNKVFGKTSIICHPIYRQLLVTRCHDVFLYFNINMFFSRIHDKMFLADFS